MGNVKKSENIHPLLLLFMIVVLCAVLSYIIPAGVYETAVDEESGIEVVVTDSFHYLKRDPISAFELMTFISQGMENAADIIFYLIIVGGMFGIVNGTGALNLAIANVMKRLKGKEIIIIPILMIFFACGAAFCGNFEEFLVFVPLILAICITAGLDSLTAVGIIFISATVGYAGAITNPFTLGTAQAIAGLPKYSGMSLRVILFIVLLFVSIVYVVGIALIVKSKPKMSGSYESDQEYNQDKMLNLEDIPSLKVSQRLVLVCFFAGIIFSVFGVIKWEFYVNELSGVFLFTGILCGAVGRLTPNKICKEFSKGCRDILLPSLMIGLASTAVLILRETCVLDTILNSLASTLKKMPDNLTACGMFFFHEIFNVVVPSGSTQARSTMPLMIAIADKAGITRQTAVLTYQLGDAFTNILFPTSGEVVAALSICHASFGKWVKYLLPLYILWVIISLVVIVIAAKVGYGPF